MPHVTLRAQLGTNGPDDLIVEIKDNTMVYLLTTVAPTVRVSAYFDRDWPQVAASYAELYINDEAAFRSTITRITAGSRTRKGITLPGPMHEGEQLIVEVDREAIAKPS